MPTDFLNLARERVVILDGAMGTSLHRYKPTDKDWGYAPNGKSLLNLSDALVYTHPEWIREIHRGFLEAGCDGIETNTFNATQIVLDEFGMGDKLEEINRLNIRIAKEVAAEFSTPDRPRFVIGSIGPGTKMPSLTDPAIYADFDTLADAYRRQIQIMIEERRRCDPDRDVLRHPPGEVRGDHRHRGDEAGRRAPAADGATDHHRREQEDAAGHGHPGGAGRPRSDRRDRRHSG